MSRWFARLAGLLVLGAAVVFPGLIASVGSSTASEGFEETSIHSYVATFDVADTGDLDVVERLTVQFPYEGKHGIFRFWDLRDPNATGARRIPTDITVTRDGHAEPVALTWERGRRYRVAKIGSPDVYVPSGDHVYTISYTVHGVLIPGGTDDPTRLYWDLIPAGWRQGIDEAKLRVHLPVPAGTVECAVGVGSTNGCAVSGRDTGTVTISAGPLAPHTPVTTRIGLDLPTPPAGDPAPWPYSLDGALGSTRSTALAILGGAGLLGLAGGLLGRRTREPEPPYPLQYAPPEGIGPAQAQYVMTERLNREAFVASVMYAAERGAVDVNRTETGWTIQDKAGNAGWSTLDPGTTQVAGLLSGPGGSFTTSPTSVSAGQTLKTELAQHEAAVKAWARRDGHVLPAGLGSWGGVMVLGAGALAALLIWSPPDGVRGWALLPGLFAIGAIRYLGVGASTKRTAIGRDLWSRIGGFRRVLSTPSSEARFDFSGKKDLYTAYLPWAVAFGCAEAWAEKYRTETGSAPPAPAYIGGYYPMGMGANPVQGLVDDFSTTVDSAISSYEATQRPSSSGGGGFGGGGFSGGGGGGGGGGGSW